MFKPTLVSQLNTSREITKDIIKLFLHQNKKSRNLLRQIYLYETNIYGRFFLKWGWEKTFKEPLKILLSINLQ